MTEAPTRAQLEAELAERAHTDDAFRAELTSNPTAVIRRELAAHGIALPDDVTVTLHEETPTALHLVLPPDPTAVEELHDEELDLVAGGGASRDIIKMVFGGEGPTLSCNDT